MVEHDGLTDARLPVVQKHGGSVVNNLYGRIGSISAIRNGAAHGDPFDTLPWGGLLEVVRDLIHCASRDRITEWQRLRAIHGENLEALLAPPPIAPEETEGPAW